MNESDNNYIFNNVQNEQPDARLDGAEDRSAAEPSAQGTPVSAPSQPLGSYTYHTGQANQSYYRPNYNYNGYYSSPYAGSYPTVTAEDHEKKKLRIGIMALVALMLCSALLGGTVCGAVFSVMGGHNLLSYQDTVGVGNGTSQKITIENNTTNAVSAVAQKVTPSVVGIVSTSQGLPGFFGQGPASSSEGSGIIYSTDGYIITNYHVISAAVGSSGKIEVYLPNDPKTAITASVVGYNSSADLAVLKIKRTGLPAVTIGDSDKLAVGDVAIAIGNPGGLSFMGSVSAGYISGLNRQVQVDSVTMTLIQTDAAINPGNSGGALVDDEGKLIGIPNVKMSDANFEGMGFAIPINTAVKICNDLITNQSEPKPYIGVEISTKYTPAILQALGYPSGAVVLAVTTGGPAALAGISSGDIITAIDSEKISSYQDLSRIISSCSVDQKITVTVYRGQKYYDIKVTVGSSTN